MLQLVKIKRTDTRLLENMSVHYSAPRGFVGRNICYAVLFNGIYYGGIVGGSATRFLPGRNEFVSRWYSNWYLEQIVNNLFYHVKPVSDKYPIRNFTIAVLKEYRKRIVDDWFNYYGDTAIALESLVQLPRTGEIYRRDGWKNVGTTVGYTCKREGGKGTDAWSGKRVWNTTELKPKLVFCRFPGGR